MMTKAVQTMPAAQAEQKPDLDVLNQYVRNYVKQARQDGAQIDNLLAILRMAAHLGNGDAARASTQRPLHWTKHLDLVRFIYEYTQVARHYGVEIDTILAQLRMAAFQGERAWLNETKHHDPHATKELPDIDPRPYQPKRQAKKRTLGMSGATTWDGVE
jgi:hypothetical protein